ncbi:hypothetical protein ACR6L2_002844, partial [Enterococcus hirae]|uniref:hypothetical protein n=1 Tax=Enterococcus sp. C51 TaxID=3231312 RepID=UPI0034A04E8D
FKHICKTTKWFGRPLNYLLRRARTHESVSCDSEIIDPTKVNYFRLFFCMSNLFEYNKVINVVQVQFL